MATLDISAYKRQLIDSLLGNEKIVAAIESKSANYDPDSPDTLIYENVFPYLRIPDVQMVAETYVLMAVDMISPSRTNEFFVNMRLTIWVMAHQETMRMTGKSSTRIDYIADEIEEMLVNTSEFGYGMLELMSNKEIILNEKYQYRELVFRNLDAKESPVKRK